ncbi:hypothetical protein CEP53_015198, partial [Fusarium sp. AF-6]
SSSKTPTQEETLAMNLKRNRDPKMRPRCLRRKSQMSISDSSYCIFTITLQQDAAKSEETKTKLKNVHCLANMTREKVSEPTQWFDESQQPLVRFEATQ